MTTPQLVTYLRSLDAVRDRSKQVFDLIVAGKADHWDWHEDKLDDVVDYCLNIIKVSCSSSAPSRADRSATLDKIIPR